MRPLEDLSGHLYVFLESRFNECKVNSDNPFTARSTINKFSISERKLGDWSNNFWIFIGNDCVPMMNIMNF